MMIRTRIAPSPTGMLHIGTVRTALFNYVFAKANGGTFLGRIEDTDKERSTQEAVDVIYEGLEWLGLSPDEEWVIQSERVDLHKVAVEKLMAAGMAYECFVSPEELEAMREEQRAAGIKIGYDGRHRNLSDSEKQKFLEQGRKPVIRFKLPTEEETVVWQDLVQGKITYPIKELDDFVIMRADGTPTYNLVVVVDDADMKISHVIRGDDHINNTPKQILLYKSLGLPVPEFAHLPLIHGPDGKKLSKRHGAVSVLEYQKMGYLPEALLNYLMRLGWSMGDVEKFSIDQAIGAFDLCKVSKGSSNFDYDKLDWLNSQYFKDLSGDTLFENVTPYLQKTPTEDQEKWLRKSLPELTARAKRLPDLAQAADFYFNIPPFEEMDEKAASALNSEAKDLLGDLVKVLHNQECWEHDPLLEAINNFIAEKDLKFKHVGMPLRVALTGTTNSPSVVHLLEVFGKEESLARINSVIK